MSSSDKTHLSKEDYKTIDINDPETRKYLSQSGHGNYSRGRTSHKEEKKEENKDKNKEEKKDKKERKEKKEERKEKKKNKEERKEKNKEGKEGREDKDKDKPFKEGQKEKSYKPDDLLGILSPVESNDHSEEELEKIEKNTRKISKDDQNYTEASVGKDETLFAGLKEDDREDDGEDDGGNDEGNDGGNDGGKERGIDATTSGSSSDSDTDFSNESEDESENESEDESDDYGSEDSVDTLEMVRELLGDFLVTSQEHVPVFERDERGRRMPPRHKNVADLLQELVYLQMGKHRK